MAAGNLEIPVERWLSAYREAAQTRDDANWRIADLLLAARADGVWLTSGAVITTFGLPRTRLRAQQRVAEAFPPESRDARLSYEAHASLASLPNAERSATLARASDEGWSDQQVRKAAVQYRQDHGGSYDDDQETSQAVQIMRAWNRASPQARRYFAELQETAGLGIVDEDAACVDA